MPQRKKQLSVLLSLCLVREYAKADFEDDETRRMIFEYFIDKIYVFEDKLIVDMFYSENHVEVSLDAFLASEEYAKESIKDLKIYQGSVFDKKRNRLHLTSVCRGPTI